ncbi:MAG: DUF3473 domain-containing protein [Planctomycetales bacterium]|nr:DUF3473 domain-containing protein [Planctomycetales bacterium]
MAHNDILINERPLNAFTVDVEDYFQVTAFERDISRNDWDAYPLRVEANTLRLLEILADAQVTGTFFVVGWIAERVPSLVEEIRRAGHEIGSHSYWHRLVYELTPEVFQADLVRSCRVLSDILGEPIKIYRAPSFSITQRSLWATDLLIDAGIEIDSSVFPIYHDRYGIPDANPAIHAVQRDNGVLWEFPPSVVRKFGFNLPVSGGGYFRLYPQRFNEACLRQINNDLKRPFVFYIHPWELDPDQPRLPAGSRLSRWRHYVNLSRTQAKLEHLLDSFRFGTISAVLAEHRQSLALTPAPVVLRAPSTGQSAPFDV